MKRGFTLIELLAVMAILAIISLIAIPVVKNAVVQSKSNLSDEQKKSIVNAARIWGSTHSEKLPEINSDNLATTCKLSLEELKKSGLLENKTIKDPNDPENTNEISGCVIVSYKSSQNQYFYEYEESNFNCSISACD